MEGAGSFLELDVKRRENTGCLWNRKQKKEVLSVFLFFPVSGVRELPFYAEKRDDWRGKHGTHRGETSSREPRPLRRAGVGRRAGAGARLGQQPSDDGNDQQ